MGRKRQLKDVNENQISSVQSQTKRPKETSKPFTKSAVFVGGISFLVLLVSVLIVYGINQNLLPVTYSDTRSKTSDQERSNHQDLGGWNTADLITLKEFGSSLCNIDTVYSDALNTAQFKKVYYKQRPVIIKFRNGAKDWTDPSKWTIDSLKKEYGDWIVKSGNAREIVRRGGNGNVETLLSEYIDRLLNSNDSSGERSYFEVYAGRYPGFSEGALFTSELIRYIFDRAFYRDSSLRATLKPPEYFRVNEKEHDGIFFLGASGSGVSFHKHADAWNGVIYGRKRWFLYEIQQTPPGGVYPGYTPKEWYRSIYSNLTGDRKPKECIQEAGDIMYIPESVYHGTINLGDTVAVGIQNKKATSKEEKLFYKVDELEKLARKNLEPAQRQKYLGERLDKCKKLLSFIPGNAEVHMKLGLVYTELGQLPSALYHTERALEIDQYFLVAMMNLADIYEKMAKAEEAENTYLKIVSLNPNFWDAFAHYGRFLINNNNARKAVPILKQGVALQPDMLPFWYHLKLAQETIEDHAGAIQSQTEIKRIESKT